MRWLLSKKQLNVSDHGWDPWFAWHPVTVEDIHGKKWTVWGEVVRRKSFKQGKGQRSWKFYRYQFDEAFSPGLGDIPIIRPNAPPPPPPRGTVRRENELKSVTKK